MDGCPFDPTKGHQLATYRSKLTLRLLAKDVPGQLGPTMLRPWSSSTKQQPPTHHLPGTGASPMLSLLLQYSALGHDS